MPITQNVTAAAPDGRHHASAHVGRPGRSGPYAGSVEAYRKDPVRPHYTLVSSDRVDAYKHGTGEHAGRWEVAVNGHYSTYHRTLSAALRAVAIAALNRAEEG